MKINIKVFAVTSLLVMILFGINIPGVEATSFTLNQGNEVFSGPPPFATVDVTATATTLTFTVTALPNVTDLLLGFGFNTDLTLAAANFTTVPTNWTPKSVQQMDGFGKFSWDVVGNAAGDRVNVATIIITPGVPFTEADFEIPNADGHMFAAHYFQPVPGGHNLTGFISDGSSTTLVPEPTSMLLLGLGLVGLAAIRRKKV
ncbi:MAG: PEP-CTERM sorting domain-containing protein [Syntrophales bacterium]